MPCESIQTLFYQKNTTNFYRIVTVPLRIGRDRILLQCVSAAPDHCFLIWH